MENFGVSNYMACAAKNLVKEEGIISTPNPKPGKYLWQGLVTDVIAFYTHDDISCQVPWKKDCVSMNVDEEKVKVQKRLNLCNLKVAYRQFKDISGAKIGFSNFA